jgi:mevalonate kinase
MSANDGEPASLQDVLDRIEELNDMLVMMNGQQDERLNDLVEIIQEMDEKLNELQESLDELGGLCGGEREYD